jgi:hypothetical protein
MGQLDPGSPVRTERAARNLFSSQRDEMFMFKASKKVFGFFVSDVRHSRRSRLFSNATRCYEYFGSYGAQPDKSINAAATFPAHS